MTTIEAKSKQTPSKLLRFASPPDDDRSQHMSNAMIALLICFGTIALGGVVGTILFFTTFGKDYRRN